IKRATSILARSIIRVHRKQRATLAIGVVTRLAQRVVSAELEHSTQPAVEANEKLSLVEYTARLVTIDLTPRRIRANTIRRQICDRERQRRVNVARANHVSDVNVVEPDVHRDVARQLAFDLRAEQEHSRSLEVWINLPDRLLSRWQTRKRRNRSRAPLVQQRVNRSYIRQALLDDARRFPSIERLIHLSLNVADAVEAVRL